MPLTWNVAKCYPQDTTVVSWRGQTFVDPEEFELLLRGPVKERILDAGFEAQLSRDLEALVTTEMASDTLAAVLKAPSVLLNWEVGEGLAETLLAAEFGVEWPWNANRDKKTPRASLPGADLVGFIGDDEETTFLFGEVKTSSDAGRPPGVMDGRSGLAHQIDALAISPEIHGALLRWLAARCKGTDMWPKFQSACRRYLHSNGTDIALVGVLLRDTPPHEDDLRSRGTALSAKASQLPRVRLDAWYLPVPISTWATAVQAP